MIRKQTITLDLYLKSIREEKIRTDQECQRLSGQWNSNMKNELLVTALTQDYMPPIILGEEVVNGIERQWIIDGLQRSSCFLLFRYNNEKITRNVDEYMIPYQKKVLNENGEAVRDDNGDIKYEIVEFDIRNKTYEQLPEELKTVFNRYQIDLSIHQNCDVNEISKLVRRYNNHKAMNQAQRAFTYIDVFAKEIREITCNKFFTEIYLSNNRDRINGTLERLVCDMVILSNYPEHYRKDSKASFKWLNENASLNDFITLNNLLTRLTESIVITEYNKELFNRKNVYIMVATFKKFTGLGNKDTNFDIFLNWFITYGKDIVINNTNWNMLDIDRSTRDTKVIYAKLEYMGNILDKFMIGSK